MRDALIVQCMGEAHANAFIDNCSLCSPSWGEIPSCPDCKSKLQLAKRFGRCLNPDCDVYDCMFVVSKAPEFGEAR